MITDQSVLFYSDVWINCIYAQCIFRLTAKTATVSRGVSLSLGLRQGEMSLFRL